MTTGHAEKPMTIAITGATGFVGRHIVRELIDRGRRVRVLMRDAAKAGRVLPQSELVEAVIGDPFKTAAMRELLAGADACIHLIGIIREARGGQTFERVHVGATRAVTEACKAAEVRRYLHMSAVAADPEGPSAYAKTKFEAELVVRSTGLDWTIFRPGMIHGPDGEFTQMMRGWAEGRRMPFVFMPYFCRVEQDGPLSPPRLVDPVVAPVHVDDVAKAFADALETPESIGEVYKLSGPERLTFPEMLKSVRDAAPHGKPGMRPIGLPGSVAAMKARAARALGLAGLLPFDAGMALMGERDAVCDNTKAAAHLGFEPRAFRESMRRYASG